MRRVGTQLGEGLNLCGANEAVSMTVCAIRGSRLPRCRRTCRGRRPSVTRPARWPGSDSIRAISARLSAVGSADWQAW